MKIIKKTSVLFLMVILFSLSGFAENTEPQDLFEQAGQLYEKEQHAQALELYRQVEKQLTDWKLFYNMGNCFFKTDRPVEAKIYYLKAKRLHPFEPSIDKNLAIINKQLNDRITEPGLDFITRLLLRVESIVSLNVLSVLLLVLVLILNGLIFNLVRRGKGRFVTYGISFSLVITLLLSGYHIYRVDKFKQRQVAVVIQGDAELRSGPGENNTILFKVNRGLKVKIIDSNSSGDWLQVSSAGDIAGWVRKSSLQRI